MFGLFRKKPAPPIDKRDWNEDWRVGDTAECIVDGVGIDWHPSCKPWNRPAFGAQFTVVGFKEGPATDETLRYYLRLEGLPIAVVTTAFRKVRPVATEQSEVVSRILNAKPGADNPREPVSDLSTITERTAALDGC